MMPPVTDGGRNPQPLSIRDLRTDLALLLQWACDGLNPDGCADDYERVRDAAMNLESALERLS